MTSFNLIKNVTESFDVSISDDFIPITSPVAKIKDTIVISTLTPHFLTYSSAEDIGIVGTVSTTPTATIMGATTVVISTTASDCYILVGVSSSFSATSITLGMGTIPI